MCVRERETEKDRVRGRERKGIVRALALWLQSTFAFQGHSLVGEPTCQTETNCP